MCTCLTATWNMRYPLTLQLTPSLKYPGPLSAYMHDHVVWLALSPFVCQHKHKRALTPASPRHRYISMLPQRLHGVVNTSHFLPIARALCSTLSWY